MQQRKPKSGECDRPTGLEVVKKADRPLDTAGAKKFAVSMSSIAFAWLYVEPGRPDSLSHPSALG
jgi:hypothetical protein